MCVALRQAIHVTAKTQPHRAPDIEALSEPIVDCAATIPPDVVGASAVERRHFRFLDASMSTPRATTSRNLVLRALWQVTASAVREARYQGDIVLALSLLAGWADTRELRDASFNNEERTVYAEFLMLACQERNTPTVYPRNPYSNRPMLQATTPTLIEAMATRFARKRIASSPTPMAISNFMITAPSKPKPVTSLTNHRKSSPSSKPRSKSDSGRETVSSRYRSRTGFQPVSKTGRMPVLLHFVCGTRERRV